MKIKTGVAQSLLIGCKSIDADPSTKLKGMDFMCGPNANACTVRPQPRYGIRDCLQNLPRWGSAQFKRDVLAHENARCNGWYH